MKYILIYTISTLLNGSNVSKTSIGPVVYDNLNDCHTNISIVQNNGTKDIKIDNVYCIKVE